MGRELQQFQQQLWQLAVFEIAVAFVLTCAMFGLLYLVIRNGVRDGIREAQRDTPRPRAEHEVQRLRDAKIPDMRAD